MANIPIDPRPFVPRGFQILDVPGRFGVKRVVVPRRQRQHEDIAIATINPVPPGQIPFENIREVMEEFLTNEARVAFRDLQPCPFGSAYVQFAHVRDRDRLVRASPIQFLDANISFVRHDRGTNWRRALFNHECGLMIVWPPLDLINTDDLAAAFVEIGKLLLWEKDPAHKERVLVKIRATELEDIPKSLKYTVGDAHDSDSWTCSVEILEENLLGELPADEDPLPGDGVDPYPLPNEDEQLQ
jgi:hypothetical protein